MNWIIILLAVEIVFILGIIAIYSCYTLYKKQKNIHCQIIKYLEYDEAYKDNKRHNLQNFFKKISCFNAEEQENIVKKLMIVDRSLVQNICRVVLYEKPYYLEQVFFHLSELVDYNTLPVAKINQIAADNDQLLYKLEHKRLQQITEKNYLVKIIQHLLADHLKNKDLLKLNVNMTVEEIKQQYDYILKMKSFV